jgi:hypothetical protein
MDSQKDAIVQVQPIPAATAVVSTEQPKTKTSKKPRGVPWSTFFLPRDWKRKPDGTPEEVMFKAKVKNEETGEDEEKLVPSGFFQKINQHLPGDTIVDGNGASYLVLPDMSLRAVSKYNLKKERRERREEQNQRLKELRAAQRQSGGLFLSKRLLSSQLKEETPA